MTTSASATWLFSQNHIQNILGKVDNNASEKGHKALRALPGIVTFEGKTDLHNAEAQQNGTNRLNGAEHKIAQCIDGRQRVVRIHRQRHHDYRGGNRGNRQVAALDFALGFRCGYRFFDFHNRDGGGGEVAISKKSDGDYLVALKSNLILNYCHCVISNNTNQRMGTLACTLSFLSEAQSFDNAKKQRINSLWRLCSTCARLKA